MRLTDGCEQIGAEAGMAQRGFSLVELVISISILSIIASMTTVALLRSERAAHEVAVKADANDTMDIILRRLRVDLSSRLRGLSGTSARRLPLALQSEPFVEFSNCRRSAEDSGVEAEQYCTKISFARLTSTGAERSVSYETKCVRAPVDGLSVPPAFEAVVDPCQIQCGKGRIPVVVISGAKRDVFPSSYRSRTVSLHGAAICFTSRTDTASTSWDGDLQVDIGSAVMSQSGIVRLTRRTMAVPLSPFLAASLERGK